MIKKLLALVCIAAICVTPIGAAVTAPVSGVVLMTANADVATQAYLPYGSKVVGVKIHPGRAASTYTLRNGTLSGAIIYQTQSASTTAPLTLDAAKFVMPSQGIYLQTEDSTPTVFLYSE